MWLSLPAMHPLNDLVHSPVIVEADINRAISVSNSRAQQSRLLYSMCHINISPVVFTCKRCFDKRRLLAAIWIAIIFQ